MKTNAALKTDIKNTQDKEKPEKNLFLVSDSVESNHESKHMRRTVGLSICAVVIITALIATRLHVVNSQPQVGHGAVLGAQIGVEAGLNGGILNWKPFGKENSGQGH